jgi:hypothetical protein
MDCGFMILPCVREDEDSDIVGKPSFEFEVDGAVLEASLAMDRKDEDGFEAVPDPPGSGFPFPIELSSRAENDSLSSLGFLLFPPVTLSIALDAHSAILLLDCSFSSLSSAEALCPSFDEAVPLFVLLLDNRLVGREGALLLPLELLLLCLNSAVFDGAVSLSSEESNTRGESGIPVVDMFER